MSSNALNFIELKPFGLLVKAEKGSFEDLCKVDVWQLIKTYKLLIFRGFTALDKNTFKQFAKIYGKLLKWDFGDLMELKVEKGAKNYLFTTDKVPYHWDGAFHTEPRLLFFYCKQAPDVKAGGETVFSDTESVWSAASKAQQDKWRSVEITYETKKLAHYGGKISVPLLKEHCDKKVPILRFAEPVHPPQLNPVDVSVVNASEQESESILQALKAAFYNPAVMLKHVWQEGDCLIADNFSLIHGRESFSEETSRHLYRVQVV